MPALSNVAIANAALSLIGDERITAFSDSSEAAKAINANYDLVRDEVTGAHPWNCALYRINLAATTTTPVYEYTGEFNLPTDPWCLRVLHVEDFDMDEWAVEGRQLYVDASSINIKYIRRITDPMTMSPGLVMAIAHRLAHQVVLRLTGDRALKEHIGIDYKMILKEARTADGLEGAPPVINSSVFEEARL